MMSERFIVDTVGSVVDVVNRDFYDYASDLVPLLNGLVDEVERLQYFESLYREQNLRLIKENGGLKHQVNYLEDRLDDYVGLEKENKKLKSENRMLKTIIGKNEQFIGSITHKGKWR